MHALELRAELSLMSVCRDSGSSLRGGGDGQILPANQPATTVMRFSVSVPVAPHVTNSDDSHDSARQDLQTPAVMI